jgi:hypothetical protein
MLEAKSGHGIWLSIALIVPAEAPAEAEAAT